MTIITKTTFILTLALAMAASAAQPRAGVNWRWFYDVENAPGDRMPIRQTSSVGDLIFYWSPGGGAMSVKDDLEVPGNKYLSVLDNTTDSAGRPIASNNNPPVGPPYNGALALRNDYANGVTITFRIKGIQTSARNSTQADAFSFYNRLLGGPGIEDRHRWKVWMDDTGTLMYLGNSQIGWGSTTSPVINDGWHDVWYTSWAGNDGLYHKRVWLDGVLAYNDVSTYAGESKPNERRWGFMSDAQTGEYYLDYLGLYDQGAIFLPPRLNIATVDGSVVITWDYGVLQETSQLPAAPGDWADVSGATSPHTVANPGSSPRKLYRVRSPAL